MATLLSSRKAGAAAPLRVMTLNLHYGGTGLGQPLSQTVEVIRAARADVVGLQETAGERGDGAARVAERLRWHHFAQDNETAIISRYPITGHTPHRWGAYVALPSGVVHVYNAHLRHMPYQPYQLLGIKYGDYPFIATEEEAIRWANEARGGQVTRLLSELNASLAAGVTCFLTGDFNEPSHLDWTAATTEAGLVPTRVTFPATRRVAEAGMRDGFRAVRPDPVAEPGRTWTPTTNATDPQDHHDRLDFVFSSLPASAVRGADVVGETEEHADIVVEPWPTDHRGVVVEYEAGAAGAAATPGLAATT